MDILVRSRTASSARAPGARASAPAVDSHGLHRPVLWVGTALSLISLSNFLILWWAPKFGNAQWEFTVVSQTLDRMPLFTVSLLLVLLGAVQSGSVWLVRATALLFTLVALWVVWMTVLFGLAGLVALRPASAAPGELATLIKLRIAKTEVTAGIYALLYAALAATLWRRSRRIPGG